MVTKFHTCYSGTFRVFIVIDDYSNRADIHSTQQSYQNTFRKFVSEIYFYI